MATFTRFCAATIRRQRIALQMTRLPSISLALVAPSADFCLVSRRWPVLYPCRFPLCEPARSRSQLSGFSLHPGLADGLRMRCVFRTNG